MTRFAVCSSPIAKLARWVLGVRVECIAIRLQARAACSARWHSGLFNSGMRIFREAKSFGILP